MATLPRIVHGPLRHERGHQFTFLEIYFAKSFKQVSSIRCLDAELRLQRSFPNTGPGFTVQAFYVAI